MKTQSAGKTRDQLAASGRMNRSHSQPVSRMWNCEGKFMSLTDEHRLQEHIKEGLAKEFQVAAEAPGVGTRLFAGSSRFGWFGRRSSDRD